MRNAAFVVIVSTLVACDRRAATPRGIAPASAPAPVATTPTRPAQPPAGAAPLPLPHYVAANQLAEAYQTNPIAADRDFKEKVIDLIGIVATIERDGGGGAVVSLRAGKTKARRALGSAARHLRMLESATGGLDGLGSQRDALRATSRELQERGNEDDRLIACRFPSASMAAVADLEPAQLVDIRGTVEGARRDMTVPSMHDASVAWAGDRPSAPPAEVEAPRRALIAARSVEVCLLQMADWGAEVSGGPSAAFASDVMVAMKRLSDEARLDLERMEAVWLSCPHPLVRLALECLEPRPIADCCTPQVKAIAALVARHLSALDASAEMAKPKGPRRRRGAATGGSRLPDATPMVIDANP